MKMQHPVRWTWALLLILGTPVGATQAPVSVADIVPDTMPRDTELAVIPKPKMEKMGDRMIVAGKVLFTANVKWEELRAGGTQLAALFGQEKADVITLAGNGDEGCDTLVVFSAVTAEGPDPTIGLAPKPRALPMQLLDTLDEVRAWKGLVRNEKIIADSARQYYYLSVWHDATRQQNIIYIKSTTPAGAFYAVQTLKQLACEKDGTVHVRECEILDWPTFAGRGFKFLPDPCWYSLKANFHYHASPPPAVREAHFAPRAMSNVFPFRKIVVNPEEKDPNKQRKETFLDASPEAVRRYADSMRERVEKRGITDFRIHLDDQQVRMTQETARRFKGDYFAALRHVIFTLHAELKKMNPDGVIYLLPTTYWTETQYPEFAAKLLAGHNPPKDFSAATNGPQVTSQVMPPDEIVAFMKAFGADQPGVSEDWHGRKDQFSAIIARPKELVRGYYAICAGTGTPTMRATRLDWAWNPGAYDPDRSLLLACREWAGLENCMTLYGLVTNYDWLPDANYRPRQEVIDELVSRFERAQAIFAEMQAMPNQGLEGRLTRIRNSREWRQLPQMMEAALEKVAEQRLEKLKTGAFREGSVARLRGAIETDGKLDEAAWAKAPAVELVMERGTVTDANRALMRCLYDDENLYVSFQMATPRPINFDARPHSLGVDGPAPREKQTGHDMRGAFMLGGWDVVSLQLDPEHNQHTCYKFEVDAAGRTIDGKFDATDGMSPNGLFWNSNWTAGVTVGETGGWNAEMTIAWRDLGVKPKPGMVMGVQVRTFGQVGRNMNRTPRWYGTPSPIQMGHLLLK